MTDLSKRDTRGPSERANHRLLVISGALGGLIGLTMVIVPLLNLPQGTKPGPFHMLNAPLPLWFAILIALLWGVFLPIISWRWHRVVDEHESRAYRDGALAGYYVVGLGAPVWWFLWRGGVLPALQAEWMYLAMMATCGIVWMWRKYA